MPRSAASSAEAGCRRRLGGGPAMAPHGASPRPRSAPLTMCWPLSSCLASTLARRPSMWPRQSTTTVCRAGEPGHRAQSGWVRPGRAGALPRRSLPAGPPLLPPLLRPPSRCWLFLAGCWAAGYAAAGLQAPPPTMRAPPAPHLRHFGARVLDLHTPAQEEAEAGGGAGLGGRAAAMLAPCFVPEPSARPARLFGRTARRGRISAYQNCFSARRGALPSCPPLSKHCAALQGRLPTESASRTIHGPLKDRAAPPSASPGHNGPAATAAVAASGPSPSHR